MAKLSMIEEAQHKKIKPADITFIVSEMAGRREEGKDCGFESQFFVLLNRHGKKKIGRIFAIMERMRCLVELMDDERMRGWTLQAIEPGCTLTHEAVFHATATCTLKDAGERFFFDSEEFFALVLQHAAPQTRA